MIVQLLSLFLLLTPVSGDNVVPEQLHLSLAGFDATTGSPTGMRIAWYTNDMPTSPPVAHYGESPTHLSTGVPATTTQYLADHGYHHVALLNCPNMLNVYYRVGSGSDNATWSKIYSFSTAKFSAKSTTVVSMFGDLGYENSTTRKKFIVEMEPEQFEASLLRTSHQERRLGLTADWSATYTRNTIVSLKDKLDMIFHAGDIGYADDAFLINPLHMTYENVYNGYMNWFQNVSTNIPYMVTPGNHESECHSPACVINHKKYGLPLSNFTAFNHRWHMPSVESGGHQHSNMWYSFNFGPVHYVSLNTETDFDGAAESTTGDSHMKNLPAGGFGYKGEYMKWLENDLATADQLREDMMIDGADNVSTRARPWIVAVGHRPYGDITEAAKLFQKYKVDVYIAGHKHSYARSNGGAFGNDTMYVVAGGAGCDEMKQGVEEFEGMVVPELHDVVSRSSRYASGVMTTNSTNLKWELIDSVTGEIIDSFELTKP